MPNLLETIRANSATPKQGLTDETGKLAALLRAKSGKEVGGGDIGASSLGEQQAVANTSATLQNQVAPAAAIQNAGQAIESAQQNQQAEAQKAEIGQGRRFNDIQTQIRTSSMLQDLEQSKGRVDQQSRDSAVNQIAQNLRLQTKGYADQLEREGQKARLGDELSFRESLARSTFGDNSDLLKQDLKGRSILDAKENEFRKAMGTMSTSAAYDIFRNDQKADKARGMYTAGAGLATAAIGAVGAYKAPAATGPAKSYGQAVDIAQSENARAGSDVNLLKSRH